MNLLVEARQAVVDRPRGYLLGIPIGAAIGIRAASIRLLEKALVLALEFVVEDDAPQPAAAARQAIRGLAVGAIDLGVVLQLARLPNTCVERLPAARLARPPLALKKTAPVLRERHDAIAVTASRHGLDEVLLPKMPQVGPPGIAGRAEEWLRAARQDASGDSRRAVGSGLSDGRAVATVQELSGTRGVRSPVRAPFRSQHPWSSSLVVRKYIVHTCAMPEIRFEWDPAKATTNARKHGVSFEEAQTAFFDDLALVIDDPEHSQDEARFVLLGFSAAARMLVVVHACRSDPDTIRIISARQASKAERVVYAKRHHP